MRVGPAIPPGLWLTSWADVMPAGYRDGMRAREPQTALGSVAWRRFLLSAWPWRSAGYLLTTPLVVMAGLPAVVLLTPWIAAAVQARAGHVTPARALLLVLAGGVLLAAAGPVAAAPVAAMERRRLALVDDRPLAPDRRDTRPVAVAGTWQWLRGRYTEPAAWRELAYTIALVTVVPVAYALTAGICLIAAVLIAGLLLAVSSHGPVSVAVGHVTSPGQAVPYALAEFGEDVADMFAPCCPAGSRTTR
jgi:Putative sensor